MSYKVELNHLGCALPIFDGPDEGAGGLVTADYEIPWTMGHHPPAVKPVFKPLSPQQRAVIPMVEVETTSKTKKGADTALDEALAPLRMELYLLARRIYGNSPDTLVIQEYIRNTNIYRNRPKDSPKDRNEQWTVYTSRGFAIWPPEGFVLRPEPRPEGNEYPWRVRVHIPNKSTEPRARHGEEWKFDRECPAASCICIELRDGTQYQIRPTPTGQGLKINVLPSPDGPTIYGKFWNLVKGIRVRQKNDDEVTLRSG